MRSVTAIILPSFVSQVRGKEGAANDIAILQSKMADKLSDELFDRALGSWPIHRRDLENITLGLPSKVFGVDSSIYRLGVLSIPYITSRTRPLQHRSRVYQYAEVARSTRTHSAVQAARPRRSGGSSKKSSPRQQGDASQPAKTEEPPPKRRMLSDLPKCKGVQQLLNDASQKAKSLLIIHQSGSTPAERAIKEATQRIDAYGTGLSAAMRDQLNDFRTVMSALPPFQREVVRLTLASMEHKEKFAVRGVERNYEELRKTVISATQKAKSDLFAECDRGVSKDLSEKRPRVSRLLEDGMAKIKKIVEKGSTAVEELATLIDWLRDTPQPSDNEPVVVLIGMPNVGKSSLVSVTSNRDPVISNYPFTTRRLKLGHVIVQNCRYGVMDTPGVLARKEKERNPIEGLTLAAVKHLPSIVVYVMDLSGMSGEQSDPRLQLRVRSMLRSQYPDRLWLDVRTKSDLPISEDVLLEKIPQGILNVSVFDNTSIKRLRRRMAKLSTLIETPAGLVSEEITRDSQKRVSRSKTVDRDRDM